jgi:hypothetical protein
MTEEFDSVHLRHGEIGRNDLEMLFFQEVQSRGAVLCHNDFESWLRLGNARESTSQERVVIHKQNTAAHSGFLIYRPK